MAVLQLHGELDILSQVLIAAYLPLTPSPPHNVNSTIISLSLALHLLKSSLSIYIVYWNSCAGAMCNARLLSSLS